MPQVLPLIPSVPNYRVGTVLGTAPFVLDVRWNGRDGAWYLDILDEDAEPILTGIRVVLGALLGGRSVNPAFPPGRLIAADLSGEGRDAGIDDLGTRVLVYFYSAAEVLELLAEEG